MNAVRALEPARSGEVRAANGPAPRVAGSKYCGVCPACKTLASGAFNTPAAAVETLAQQGLSAAAYRTCVAGYLQEHYGNSFTGRVLTGLSRYPAAPAATAREADNGENEKTGWLAGKLAGYANHIPGFRLVTYLLGKNPINNRPVERSGKALVEALLGLVPGGAALFKHLDESGAVDRALAWITQQLAALDITWSSVKQLFKRAWDEVSLRYGIDQNIAIVRNIFAPVYEQLKHFAVATGKMLYRFVFEGVLKMLGAPVEKVMGLLNKAGDAVALIAADPIGFLKKLLAALSTGFHRFKANILEHLKQGLFGWLFGALAGAGITVPKTFDLKSIFGLVMQVLGLTRQFLRRKVARVIGEQNVALIEKAWSFVSNLIGSGISGLWEMAREYLGNLMGEVIAAIRDWVVTKIVTAAILKLVSMFNPVGAVIAAIKTIYNVVMFFIERMQQILALVEAVFQSLLFIAGGAVAQAAEWIEKTMARTLPVIISFLARLLGLGGISAKIKEIIKKLQVRVENAVDRVIQLVAGKVGGLLAKGKAAVARVVEWWQERKEFEADGKKGQIYFAGGETNARLLISFSPGVPYTTFLNNIRKNMEPGREKTYSEAWQLAQQIEKRRAVNKTEEQHAADVRHWLNELAPKLGVLTGGQQAPESVGSVVTYGPLTSEQGGSSATAETLTKNQPRGTAPDDEPAIWRNLGALRYKEPWYVQGHLLNEHLGGPGKRFNLTPITKKANAEHLHSVEKHVKQWVAKGKVVYYRVQAEYGRSETNRYKHFRRELEHKKKLNPKVNAADETRLSELAAECKLPAGLKYTAYIQKPEGKKWIEDPAPPPGMKRIQGRVNNSIE